MRDAKQCGCRPSSSGPARASPQSGHVLMDPLTPGRAEMFREASAGVSRVRQRPRRGPDVGGGRADQAPGALLLEDVRRPAGRARAREQRQEQGRRDLREVEDHRRPELDVGREHAVGLAGLELLERGVLELCRDLGAGGIELRRGLAQHPRARILGAVDAVAEAHQALASVEDALDVPGHVALPLDRVEHREDARGRTAVERAGERADGGRERGGDVGAGGRHDARRERGGVAPVLGRGDPVGVERAGVRGVGVAAPAGEEPRGGAGIAVAGGPIRRDFARDRGRELERRRRRDRELVARLLGVEVDQRAHRQPRDRGLQLAPRVAAGRPHLAGGCVAVRQPGQRRAVDQQAPYLLEGDPPDELLHIHAAVAQRAAGTVGLRDLGGERHHAFEAPVDPVLDRCAHASSVPVLSTLTKSMLTAMDAASRLGVKPETLYAYVSRGMLTRHRAEDGRRSLFERAEIERLAARSRRGGRAAGLEVVVDTSITRIDAAGALYYRGRDATRLARERRFEEVAELLWGGDEEHSPWAGPTFDVDAGRLVDGIRVIVAPAAAADPLRHVLRPPAVRHTARGLIAAMVDGLPRRSEPAGGSIAARVWSRVHDAPPPADRLAALDAALVLLADHELAVSALSARVAASAWADPYLVVLAGLSALGGPLHGGAPGAIERLLGSIRTQDDVPAVLGERLATGAPLPGFGHAIYTGRDPRAETLLQLLREIGPERLPVIEEVLHLAGRHGGPEPNLDLALAALSDTVGLVAGAAEVIFAVARTAGFIAHALEEYPYRLRFRARAAYVGV